LQRSWLAEHTSLSPFFRNFISLSKASKH
jgi:hypothetical protein